MRWPSKDPADYRSPEPAPRDRFSAPATPPHAAKGVMPPHPKYWFDFQDEDYAGAAARELEQLGFHVKVDQAGGLFTRRRWELEAVGAPEGIDAYEAVDLFERWACARGGEYSTHDVPRTRTQSFCIVLAVAACRAVEYLLGLELDDFLANLAALAVGIPGGYAIARQVEPPSEPRPELPRAAS